MSAPRAGAGAGGGGTGGGTGGSGTSVQAGPSGRRSPPATQDGDVGQRQVDQPAAAVPRPGTAGRGRGRQPGQRVGQGVAGEHGTRRGPGHEARGRGGVVAERHPLGARARPPVPGDREPEAGPVGSEVVGGEPELGQGAGPRRLDHDVGRAEQIPQRIPSPRGRHVERHRPLPAVEAVVEQRRAAAGAVGPGRRLDLDHVGSRGGQQAGAHRPGPQRREIHDERRRPGWASSRAEIDPPARQVGGSDVAASDLAGLPFADGSHRQAEQAGLGDERGTGAARHFGDDRGPRVGAGGSVDLQPGGDRVDVLGPDQAGGQPPVGGPDEAGAPAAAHGALPPQPGHGRPLGEHGPRVGAGGGAEPGDARQHGRRRHQPGPVGPAGERRGAAADPRRGR